MPSNIDKAFIDNLQNFTESLENIVELMKQQSKKGDAVNQMLSTLDGPKLSDISKDIKEILSVSKKIDNRTKKILEEVKASRKQKEAGLFDKVQDPKNKDKIVDGIKVIGLIAGGVLAIGMAFKIVGNVDFLSVVALSAGILMVSKAFAEIASIDDLSYRKVFMAGLSIIVIAGTLVSVAHILQSFKPISANVLLSFVLISSTIGVASYYIIKAIGNLKLDKPSDLAKYFTLPIILPLIAAGIVASSHIISFTSPVGLIEAISTVFVGLALVAGAFAVSMVVRTLKDKDGKIDTNAMIVGLSLIPSIAAGIVLASLAFQLFHPINNPLDLVLSSLAMGVAILAFSPSVWLLGQLDIKQMFIGSLGTVVVSGAIAASSWILSIGNYDKYPSARWAAGVGLSILLFTPAVLALGIIGVSGIGALAILAGAGLIMVVASAITGVSHILNKGDYGKYPGIRWATGVGLSLMAFVPAVLALGIIGLISSRPIRRGGEMVKMIAQNIVDVSEILSSGNFRGGPTEKWAKGIGLSLNAFAYALSLTLTHRRSGLDGDFGDFMVAIAKSMKIVADEIGMYNWDNLKHPSEEWAKGVGGALVPFAEVFEIINSRRKTRRQGAEGFTSFMEDIANSMIIVAKIIGNYEWSTTKYPNKAWGEGVGGAILPFSELIETLNERRRTRRRGGEGFAKFMVDISQGMVDVAEILNKDVFRGGPNKDWSDNLAYSIKKFNESVENIDRSKIRDFQRFITVLSDFSNATERLSQSGIDKLNKLTTSVTIISVIDDQRLQSTLRVLDQNKRQVSNIIEKTGESPISPRQITTPVSTVDTSLKEQKTKQDDILEKFDTVIEKFDELLEFVIQEKSPESTGKPESTKRGGWFS